MTRSMPSGATQRRLRLLTIIGGPVCCAAIMIFADLQPGAPIVTRAAAVTFLMALWWLTGALPLAVTALLPVVLFPTLGIMSATAVPVHYMNDVIFLFLGGFLVALAMERWNLHRRIALRTLLFFGLHPRRMLLGFMAPTYFLSMWISNTATAMMVLPIALSIIMRLEEDHDDPVFRRYSVGLLLAIAYSASVGGVATLIGTPPNLAFVRILSATFPNAPEISFATWFFFAFPLSLFLFVVLWSVLAIAFCPRGVRFHADEAVIRRQYDELGPFSFEEKTVAGVLALMAVLWFSRPGMDLGAIRIPGWAALFNSPEFVNDGTVAITMAMLLFMISSKREAGQHLLDWETAKKLPWDIVLLLGGGFALAASFQSSGLSDWMGAQLHGLDRFHPFQIVLITALTGAILTEFTSNSSATQVLLPIIASVAVRLNLNPLLLMVPATLACSFAFMFPVSTPPNAIVFGAGRIRMIEMARVGAVFMLLCVLVVTLAMMTFGRLIFDIDLSTFPDWASAAPNAT